MAGDVSFLLRRLLQTVSVPDTSENDINTTWFTMTTYQPMTTEVDEVNRCDKIEYNYQIVPAIICAMCFLFGILYTFFGYRFFKAVMFLTGFIFGSVLIYLICYEQSSLPSEANAGIAVGAGILCGLITMLVQYVGLFMTGFHFGLSIAVSILIVIEQFYHPTTKWIPIGILLGIGILFAVLILKFQRTGTILGTSIFGGALMVTSLDYFIELFMMVQYVFQRLKAEGSETLCWFSWLVLGCWPFCFIVGAITQWKVTGHGIDHKEVLRNKKMRRVNLQRIRAKQRRDTQQLRYRHLYQVRRCNGDVIAQSYIKSIQHKLSPAMQSLTSVQTEPMTELESANTTLTQVP